jgi:7-alpha-hydroxysteroid dehydrogenase
MIAVTPMGRIGEAAEAAEAALFLASPAAGFITGQIVAVDGGRLVLDPLASPVR